MCVCNFQFGNFPCWGSEGVKWLLFLALQTFLFTKPYSIKISISESCFCYPYHLFGLLFRWEHRERWKRCLHVLCQRWSLRLLQLSALWPRWSWSQTCQCRYSFLLLFLYIICFYDKKIRGLGGRKKITLFLLLFLLLLWALTSVYICVHLYLYWHIWFIFHHIHMHISSAFNSAASSADENNFIATHSGKRFTMISIETVNVINILLCMMVVLPKFSDWIRVTVTLDLEQTVVVAFSWSSCIVRKD